MRQAPVAAAGVHSPGHWEWLCRTHLFIQRNTGPTTMSRRKQLCFSAPQISNLSAKDNTYFMDSL